MSRPDRLILMASLVLALCACSSTPTHNALMDFDPNFNFSGVRNIAIQPFDRSNAASVTVSDIQVARIREALTTELERRGFNVVAENSAADMLLAWHLVTQERTDVRSFNTASRYNCWSCPTNNRVTVRQYTQGTFIVDLIDPVSLNSVWRSTLQSRMRSEPDPERAAENRSSAARAVFAEFPPPQ